MSDIDVSSLSQEDTDALLAMLLEKKKQAEKKSPPHLQRGLPARGQPKKPPQESL